MEYVHQKRVLRKKIFYGLLLVFLVLAPALIAYAFGYNIDLGNLTVTKVGGVFLKSNLSRINIFFDGALARETSFFSRGALFSSVTPGIHLVRIEKQDFKPWSKTIEVYPALVTELRNILLLPRELERATTTPREIELIQAVQDLPSGKFVIDARNNLVNTADGKIILPQVKNFKEFEDEIAFLDLNDFAAVYTLPDKKVRVLGRPGFYLNSGRPPRFFRSSLGDIIIMDSSGAIFLFDRNGSFRVLEGGVLEVILDSEKKKLLLLKEQSIDLIWLDDNPRQPFQAKFSSEKIVKIDSRIRQADWYYKSDMHVFFRTAEGVFITEVDGRGGRNTVQLFSENIDELAVVPEIPEVLFFRQGKTFYRVDL